MNEKLIKIITFYLEKEAFWSISEAKQVKLIGEILIRHADMTIGTEELMNSLKKDT